MFEGLFYLVLYIIGGGMLLIGLIAIGYGLYGMSISGFDKSVRNFSLALGIILIGTVTFFYLRSKSVHDQKKLIFVGQYENAETKKLQLELFEDNTFQADSLLTHETNGIWYIIDDDEVDLIEFSTEEGALLNQFEFIIKNDTIQLNVQYLEANTINLIKKM